MDFKDMMNQMGIDVYTVDNTGVKRYKPEENPLNDLHDPEDLTPTQMKAMSDWTKPQYGKEK